MNRFIALATCAVLTLAATPGAAFAAASPHPPAQPTQISVQHTIVAVGAPIAFRATLTTADSSPVSNAAVKFTLDGTQVSANATTDGTGLAKVVIPYPNILVVGQRTIRAVFAGNSNYAPSTGTGDLSILKSSTSIGGSVSGITIPNKGPAVAVKGTLVRDTDKTGIPGRMIRIFIDNKGEGLVGTDATGNFAINVLNNRPAGIYTLRAQFEGDDQYAATDMETSIFGTGPKTTLFYNRPHVGAAGGNFSTGQVATVSAQLTTQNGQPAPGVHLLICLPVLNNQGFKDPYRGCDDATTDAHGVATKFTIFQVGGPNTASIDLNPDPRYTDGSHATTTVNVKKSATKIVANVPSTMLSPGDYDITASVVALPTTKPVPCATLTLALQPPGYGWSTVDSRSACGPVKLHIGLATVSPLGAWNVKISMDANDGFLPSSATFPVTVTKAKVKTLTH